MRAFVLDFETHRIRPDNPLPRPVCAGVAFIDGDEVHAETVLRGDALDLLETALADPSITIINHNLGFDLGVAAAERPRLLRPIMDAYDSFRARCTMIRQILIDISLGEAGTDDGKSAFRRENPTHWDFTQGPLGVRPSLYGLADLMRWYFNETLVKDETRTSYGRLDGLSLSAYSEWEREYPSKDAISAWRLFGAQKQRMSFLRAHPDMKGAWESEDGEIPDEANQQRKFALKLMEARGLRTDSHAVVDLRAHYEDTKEKVQTTLFPLGMKRADGSTNKKVVADAVERVCGEIGEQVDRTPTGQVAQGGDFLKRIGRIAEKWEDTFAEIHELGKALRIMGESASELSTVNTWLRWLEMGTRVPVCPSYWPLVASGRISAREPNVTNPPRKGAIRNCVWARPDHVLVFADYDTAEMRSHAQNCLDLLKWSDLAEAFKRGEDPHLSFAADDTLGISYAEALRRYEDGDPDVIAARQWAKIPDFGFPGGLGAKGFVEYAAGYGYTVDLQKAYATKNAFERKWRENPRYFELIKSVLGEGPGVLQQLWSKRVRGGLYFTEAANTMFQGRTADGMYRAQWFLARECYLGDWTYPPQNEDEARRQRAGETSPLLNSRPIVPMHDETVAEVPDPEHDRTAASRAADRLAYVMRSAMQEVTPDVPALCSASMARRWFKGSKAVRVEDGILRPSKPIEIVGADGKTKTKWVIDEDERTAA